MADNPDPRGFDYGDDQPGASRRFGPMVGAVAVALLLAGAGWFLLGSLGGGSAPKPPPVQQISIVQPPPPPPPPPKMEEPEPPEVEELEIEENEPEPMAEDESMDEPPGEELGLDAEGVAGSDAFGLAGKKGGRGLIGGGDVHAWYAGVIQRDLQAALSEQDRVRHDRYSVIVNIWLAPDGVIEQSELVRGTENAELDAAIRRALRAGVRISREPPDDLPQPVRLRITSRG